MSTPSNVTNEHESCAALADLIDAHSEEILARWLDRVQQAAPANVGRPQLRDAMPNYIACLSHALRTSQPLGTSGAAVWQDVAREHALTRVRLGFDIEELVREFIVLRQVISDLTREGDRGDPNASRIAELIEAGIAVAVRSYVEARDYAVRQKEAEHISFLTHELRNPLTTVKLAAGRLRGGGSQSHERVLELLLRNVDRLDGLIDGVLHAERLEAGKIEPRVVDLQLGELLEGPIAAAEMAAEAKGLGVHASYDPQVVVKADRELTRSAVSNVLDNAVKYTDSGEIRILVEPSPSAVILHVWDSCPGLSEQELNVIFEPFERGHARQPGAGLGLAIARRALEAQGGSIGAESKGDGGCHFWIAMPRVTH